MRFSTSNHLDINDHLKAHLGYKSYPRTLGTEDLVYGGTRTHHLVVDSQVPLGHPPQLQGTFRQVEPNDPKITLITTKLK